MVALQVIVTSFLTLSILVGSPEHRIRDQCLGNYMIHYTRYFSLFLLFSVTFNKQDRRYSDPKARYG